MPKELENEFPDFREWENCVDDERFVELFAEALETKV
jgi:hypothetical protein